VPGLLNFPPISAKTSIDFDTPSFIAFRVSGRLVQAKRPGKGRLERGQHRFVRRKKRDRLLVYTFLGPGRLNEADHNHFRGVVADRQIIREILGDLIPVLLVCVRR